MSLEEYRTLLQEAELYITKSANDIENLKSCDSPFTREVTRLKLLTNELRLIIQRMVNQSISTEVE
jgi:hypothetical protein